MDDALRVVLDVEELDAEVGAVLAQRVDLLGGDLVDDVEAIVGAGGGDVVVDGGDVAVGAAELAAGEAEAVEGLRRGDLVDEVEVDVEDRGLACGSATRCCCQTFSKRVFGAVFVVICSSRLKLVGLERRFELAFVLGVANFELR